jgi:hypothetical protein
VQLIAIAANRAQTEAVAGVMQGRRRREPLQCASA